MQKWRTVEMNKWRNFGIEEYTNDIDVRKCRMRLHQNIERARTAPRQATGPTRSGAGVGVGILRKVLVSWKSQRFKHLIVKKYQGPMRIQDYLEIPRIHKLDRPKLQRFHADPTLLGNPKDSKKWSSKNTKILRGFKTMEHGQRLFQKRFDLIGFTYVLEIWESQRFIKILPSYNSLKTLG